ncbi:hypothetical protein SCAR479_13880 [Seiridium cardinale]|uniref:Uncharacterized protein n=1 Tax=Seiridium cardinale TaxID=138064 RepID=A0ABR2X6R0_9PEZI
MDNEEILFVSTADFIARGIAGRASLKRAHEEGSSAENADEDPQAGKRLRGDVKILHPSQISRDVRGRLYDKSDIGNTSFQSVGVVHEKAFLDDEENIRDAFERAIERNKDLNKGKVGGMQIVIHHMSSKSVAAQKDKIEQGMKKPGAKLPSSDRQARRDTGERQSDTAAKGFSIKEEVEQGLRPMRLFEELKDVKREEMTDAEYALVKKRLDEELDFGYFFQIMDT